MVSQNHTGSSIPGLLKAQSQPGTVSLYKFFTIFLPHFLSICNIKYVVIINFVYLDKFRIVFYNIGIFFAVFLPHREVPESEGQTFL